MWQNPQGTADLVTFTEEILNEKFIFCVVTAISISYSLVGTLASFHCTRNKLFDKEFPHFLYSVRFWDSYPPVWFGASPSLSGSRLALGNQKLPVRVRLLAICRRELSAVMPG